MNNNKLEVKRWISVNEASNIINKSIPTIRKLIQDKKVVVKKEGVKVLIELSSINKLYQTVINNVINNDINKEEKGINNNSESSILSQNIIDNLIKENESLKLDKSKHFEETKRFQDQLDKFHTLMENQQTLMLGLQQQIKSLTDNTKSTAINDQNSYQNDQNVTEVKVNLKRKKWWFF